MIARIMRTDAPRWLSVVLIAPMLLLGAFNRTAFLVHGHGDQGMHLHPVAVLDDGRGAAEDRADHHGHDHAACRCDAFADWERDCHECAGIPCGVVISFDVDALPPTRALDLGKTLPPAAMHALVLPAPPEPDRSLGSSGGAFNRGPMNLLALSAVDRLVRTSLALLI